jgi:hypothetical protein
MDPYLEKHWGDVHTRLITYSADQLQNQLPKELRARAQERVYVEAPAGDDRVISPDIAIIQHGRRPASLPSSGGSATALAELIEEEEVLRIPDEPVTETFLEIIDISTGGRLVTNIEFVSPSNKLRGSGRELYLRKQDDLRYAIVNSVEIDLTRTGDNVMAIEPATLKEHFRTPYRACVRRIPPYNCFEVYRMPLQKHLPKVRIPLRATDTDVTLDLQAIIEQCYRNGGYDDIDYSKDPVPPLMGDDATWTDEMLKAKGVRKTHM